MSPLNVSLMSKASVDTIFLWFYRSSVITDNFIDTGFVSIDNWCYIVCHFSLLSVFHMIFPHHRLPSIFVSPAGLGPGGGRNWLILHLELLFCSFGKVTCLKEDRLILVQIQHQLHFPVSSSTTTFILLLSSKLSSPGISSFSRLWKIT